MKFVLNTSFDPHFCALFDAQDVLIAQSNWLVPREDGQKVWNFLKKHLPPEAKISFIGGISGPGSFSSLRAGGAILNALAFKFNLSIHQVRADQVIIDFLKKRKIENKAFLLNSFSNRVFTIENKKLVSQNFSTLNPNTPFITTWLPENKTTYFTTPISVDPLGPLHTILETLQKTAPQKEFIPDYEYPAVQP